MDTSAPALDLHANASTGQLPQTRSAPVPALGPTKEPSPASNPIAQPDPTPTSAPAPSPVPQPPADPTPDPNSRHAESPQVVPRPVPLPHADQAAPQNAAQQEFQSRVAALAPPARSAPADWPGPPDWIPGLSEKNERQLAHILRHMHAMARASGYGPTEEAFHHAAQISPKAYLKFFPTYTDFVTRCGYKTCTDKRRRAKIELRKAMSRASRPALAAGTDAAVFGEPIVGYDLLHAPVNEQGVVMLFGMMAKKLGFQIEIVRTGYPDCEAKRKCEDGKWRRVRIEFEYETSRFDHDPSGCDLVVCWEHNAKNIGVDVLELKKHFEPEPQPKTQEHANAA